MSPGSGERKVQLFASLLLENSNRLSYCMSAIGYLERSNQRQSTTEMEIPPR